MLCKLCSGPLAWTEEWLDGTLVARLLRCRWCMTEQTRKVEA